jgi:hypothetical protein
MKFTSIIALINDKKIKKFICIFNKLEIENIIDL